MQKIYYGAKFNILTLKNENPNFEKQYFKSTVYRLDQQFSSNMDFGVKVMVE